MIPRFPDDWVVKADGHIHDRDGTYHGHVSHYDPRGRWLGEKGPGEEVPAPRDRIADTFRDAMFEASEPDRDEEFAEELRLQVLAGEPNGDWWTHALESCEEWDEATLN